MKKYILAFILVVSISLTTSHLMAQPGFDDDVTDAPIDGGVSILALAGIAYGAKQMLKKKNEE